MIVRRLLIAAALLLGGFAWFAPAASAGSAVCAWVDPNGVCISNPLGGIPRLPRP
jgi:hypothetical protein